MEAGRRNALYEQVQRLESNLDSEIKRRAEADRALQEKLEGELKAMEESFGGHMREMQVGLKASIDALSRTFAELHNGGGGADNDPGLKAPLVSQSLIVKKDSTIINSCFQLERCF